MNRSVARRAESDRCSDSLRSSSLADEVPRDAAAVPQGRRSAARRRSRTPGSCTVEDLLYRFPIRYEDRSRLQPIASLKPGQTASIAGRILSCGLRSTRRPGFKIFEALVADDERLDARDVAQPAVSARRVHRRPARRAVRPRRDARRRRPAADQSAVRDSRRRRGRDDPHRPHRAGLREDRQRHAEDPAPARLRRAAAAARWICPISCRSELRLRLELPARRRGAARARTFRPSDTSIDASEPLRHAGPAAPDLRRSVPVSARRARATPCAPPQKQAGGDSRRRSHPRIGARGAAVQADGGAASRRSRRSSTICSARSR